MSSHQDNPALDGLDEIEARTADMLDTLDRMWTREQEAARDRAAERRRGRQQLRVRAARRPRRRTIGSRPRERRGHRARARVAARSPDDSDGSPPGPPAGSAPGFRTAEPASAADPPQLPTPRTHLITQAGETGDGRVAPQTASPRGGIGDWSDWPADWPPRDDRHWGRALSVRYPRPPRRRDLAGAGWDRAAYRRQLAADLQAAIVELHRVDVPWVLRGGDRLADRCHRARLALDRLVAQARHELLAIAEENGQLDVDALDWSDPFPGRDELAALPPSADPPARTIRDLLDAELELSRRRDGELARFRAARQRPRRRRA